MISRLISRRDARSGFLAIGVAALLLNGAAAYGATPEQRCQSGKNKAAGKYAFCRQKAEAKFALLGDAVKYNDAIVKCEVKVNDSWTKLEAKAADQGGACLDGAPTVPQFKAVIDDHANTVAGALAGGPAVGCGNGFINAGEQCDANNLNGATCASQGFAFGTLQCSASCTFDTSGCQAVRFTDNGDGTIFDALTGLMWEKKGHLDGTPVVCSSAVACPDPHDADNEYTYSADNPTGPPGTAFTVFLTQLNAGGGFAGHTDWRLPTREELQGLVDYADATSPSVLPFFDTGCSASCAAIGCSCTSPGRTWTNDLVPSIVGNAWLVEFGDGTVLNDTRDTTYNARAVR